MDALLRKACGDVLAYAIANVARAVVEMPVEDIPEGEDERLAWAIAVFYWLEADPGELGARAFEVKEVLDGMLAKLLAQGFSAETPLERLVAVAARGRDLPLLAEVLGAVERTTECPEGELRELLTNLQEEWAQDKDAEARRFVARLSRLLKAVPVVLPEPGYPWSQRARFDVGKLKPAARAPWHALFGLALRASSARPSSQWLAAARRHVAAIGQATFSERAIDWLGRFENPNVTLTGADPRNTPGFARNEEFLRGLVWACSTFADVAVASTVGDLGVVCFTKIPGWGTVSTRVGNACIYTLGAMPDRTGVVQLDRLQHQVKYSAARTRIDEATDTAAARAGMTREDLEELSVPTFGLTLADNLARHAGRGPALEKKTAKDIAAIEAAQCARLERLLGPERTWSLADARSRLLDHPLVAVFARRLIWQLHTERGNVLATWVDDHFVDITGNPVTWAEAPPRVSLWHPLGTAAAEALAWRARLEALGVTQPFKQAHREIYLLTDDERRTETYSNRFAGHFLRQRQLVALCRERGWKCILLAPGRNPCDPPERTIRSAGLTAEFGVRATEKMTSAGSAVYVTSDRVVFSRPDPGEVVRMQDVPPLVFSEVMRDIDLFVSACSVGNDPTRHDPA